MIDKVNKKYHYLCYDKPIPDLSPSLSTDLHFHGHHKVYEAKYNTLVQKYEDLANLTPAEVLDKIWSEIRKNDNSRLDIFRNGLQALNHELFWESLELSCDQINGILNENDFLDAGCAHFGSGWLWIVEIDDKIDICTTSNEESPRYHRGAVYTYKYNLKVTNHAKVLAVIDLWEHAYYKDYDNLRRDYLQTVFRELLDWRRLYRVEKHNLKSKNPDLEPLEDDCE